MVRLRSCGQEPAAETPHLQPQPQPPAATLDFCPTSLQAAAAPRQQNLLNTGCTLGCPAASLTHALPWLRRLRALVLGANDGLVSVAALMMGVGGGTEDRHTLLLSGVAGLVGGALSMAVGEYISVSSQVRSSGLEGQLSLTQLD